MDGLVDNGSASIKPCAGLLLPLPNFQVHLFPNAKFQFQSSINHNFQTNIERSEAMGLYAVAAEGIQAYLGLSITEFLSIGTLMVVTYKIVCGMFVSDEDFKPKSVKKIEPIQLGDDVSKEELIKYNGSDPKKPLLMAIRGQIYDVSSSRMFYGPGSPYHMFVGKDASRALALLSFKPDDITGNIEGLGEDELAVLLDWEMRFIEKYPRVGQLVGAGRRLDLEMMEGTATSSEQPPWRLAEESKKVM